MKIYMLPPPNSQNTGDRFTDILKAAHEKTGHRAVVLIDEYDKLLLDVLDTRLSSMVDGEMFPCVLFHIQSLLFPFMA